MDDALKAGHCVEPERETQLWANAADSADARNTSDRINCIIGAVTVFLQRHLDLGRSRASTASVRVLEDPS